MHSYDVIGSAGVVIILIAYGGLQFKKISASSFWYSFLNIIGSLAIVYSLLHEWNFSAFIMEVVWIIFSVYGLWCHFRDKHFTK